MASRLHYWPLLDAEAMRDAVTQLRFDYLLHALMFMPLAPLWRLAFPRHSLWLIIPAAANPMRHILVHTGQHYSDNMSRAFFKDLGIPEADINLGVGSGSHAEQVGKTMMAFEKVIRKEKPDWVVVVGDVNATCACSAWR